MAMVAVAQASTDLLDEETKKKGFAPRNRKSLVERFFQGEWGRSVSLSERIIIPSEPCGRCAR